MSKIDEARKIINDTDAKMAELFVQRMKAAEIIYEHKKEYGLPILDEKTSNSNSVSTSFTFPFWDKSGCKSISIITSL